MQKSIIHLIDEAIKLEYNMSKLYGIFSEYIDEDRIFWNRLENEEKNHAALLKTAKDFEQFNRFPKDLVPENIEVLVDSNHKVLNAIDEFILNPDREKAISLALELEKSAGEIHFQHFMESNTEDKLMVIFQQLNKEDKNHVERIKKHLQEIHNKGL